MLDRETTVVWAKALVAFINRDISAAKLSDKDRRPDLISLTLVPFQHRGAAHYAQLRAQAEKDLRAIAREADSGLRRNIGEAWLANDSVTGSSAGASVPLDGVPHYDAGARLKVSMPRVQSVHAFVAFTIAELVSSESPVEVRECGLQTCTRLFVRELVKAGRPQVFCSEAHASTWRTHRVRDKREESKLTRAEKLELERLLDKETDPRQRAVKRSTWIRQRRAARQEK